MIAWLLLTCLAPSPGDGEPGRFTFRDAEDQGGRRAVHFREIVLRPEAPGPVEVDPPLPEDVRYGMVLLGERRDESRMLAWAAGELPPVLWFDADGDSVFAPHERHVVEKSWLTIDAPISTLSSASQERLAFTVLLRRSALPGGLQYAVRGCTAGELSIAGRTCSAFLADADANGLFGDAGADRVWIDLNGDGRFDGLSEQFLLGRPIPLDGADHVVSANPGGTQVRAHRRSDKRGAVRVLMGREVEGEVARFSASLLSDMGELISVDAPDAPAEVPIGLYRLSGLSLTLRDERGFSWSYEFTGGKGDVRVTEGGESSVTALADLSLSASVSRGASRERLTLTPDLGTPSGLYLSLCEQRRSDRNIGDWGRCTISARKPDGTLEQLATSGFA